MTRLLGLDVSHRQGPIDWRKVGADGRAFVFVKATEGLHFVDPTFASNRAGARAAGLHVSPYHYAQPAAGGGRVQAQHLAATIGTTLPGELRPMLDLEEPAGMTPAALQDWAGAFSDELRRQLGVEPILYTGASFWEHELASTTRWPLFLARYNVTPPAGPWAFWQWSSVGRVPGIAGNVDVDLFAGDRAALAKLTIPAPKETPVTQPNLAPAQPPAKSDHQLITETRKIAEANGVLLGQVLTEVRALAAQVASKV